MRERIPNLMPIPPAFGAIALLMLAGCSAIQWEKAGTDAATADEDLRKCEQQAKGYARRPGIADQPTVIVSGRGAVGVAVPSPGVPRDDPAAEYDAVSACMRDKGYRQRPVP